MKNNLWCGRIVHRKTHCTQILRIMRLTVFFLLFIVFETYSLNVRSQNQKVTMNKGTATLSDIIRQIEKQTDYLFIYNEHEIALDKRIAVSTRLPKFLIEFCKEQVSRIRWKATILFW